MVYELSLRDKDGHVIIEIANLNKTQARRGVEAMTRRNDVKIVVSVTDPASGRRKTIKL